MQKLPVMEHFYTVQGEGYHAGRAAYFIRLAGCDVGCVWCDVKESWEIEEDQYHDLETIVKWVLEAEAEYVIITGGEPAMYDLTALCEMFKSHQIELGMETSGAYEIKGDFDWICVSPKKFKKPQEEVLKLASEFKVIVFNKHDYEWGLSFESFLPQNCKKYFQPEWSKEEEMIPGIVSFVRSRPDWRISLQTHKYMKIP